MPRLAIVMALLLGLTLSTARAAEVTARQTERGVTIDVDGQPFTEYLIKSGSKPVLWPLIGPTGKAMTRSYPMQEVAGDEKDHVHHRSVWFTHGKVNGVDFWLEGKHGGIIVHRRFSKVESGPRASIVSENDWLDPDGKKICEDERRLTFQATAELRLIDFDVTVKASEAELTFGETKEGTFGVRVAETIKVKANRGGRIVNSEGQTDDAAWGKPAAWVDYHGPVDGQTVGIAILNHPSSFRYPTHWHVRTYGLFAANPFGNKDFGQTGEGQHVIPRGGSMRLRHRIILHAGDEKQAGIANAFEEYAATEAKLLSTRAQPIVVNVSATGTYTLHQAVRSIAELRAIFEESATHEPAPVAVAIRADKQCPWRYVLEIVDLCKTMEIRDYTLTAVE